jgi:hypothetical protein
MPYRNEVQPLNLFSDYLQGRQASISQQAGQQQNALRGLQIQQQQGLNALGQNPQATPEQYIRAGDVQTGAALQGVQQQGQQDKQQALARVGGIAKQALSIQDPAQRKGFLQQALQAYGQDFTALGADMSQVPQMLQMPDDQLMQRLQQVSQFAPAASPIKLAANESLVRPSADGSGVTSLYTAPAAPNGLAETARHNRAMEQQAALSNTASRAPSGYRINPDGSLAFIPGGPADPNTGKGKITDVERQTAAYADRMRKSADLVSALDYIPTTGDMIKFNYVLGGPGVKQSLANKNLSPEAQQYLQAVQDFNRAKLRKESGAAIGKEEVFGDLSTFFPVPGDDKRTLEQKSAARETAIQGMINSAGGAYKASPTNSTSFDTEAEAEAAAQAGKLKIGDRVKIGGISGTWQ